MTWEVLVRQQRAEREEERKWEGMRESKEGELLVLITIPPTESLQIRQYKTDSTDQGLPRSWDNPAPCTFNVLLFSDINMFSF